jgi:hypothetical protein
MAVDAARLNDPRDLIAIGHVPLRSTAAHASDTAANRSNFWRTDGMVGQDRFNRVFQMVLRDGLARIADAELVVDFSVVADHAPLIENERFRRTESAELVGDMVARIFQYGERDPAFGFKMGDGLQRILLVGVDRDELNVAGFVFAGEFGQSRSIHFRERAVDADESDNDRLAIFPVGQRVSRAQAVV